jgi:hypothetical protein
MSGLWRIRTRRTLLGYLVLVVQASVGFAQSPESNILGVFPPGGGSLLSSNSVEAGPNLAAFGIANPLFSSVSTQKLMLPTGDNELIFDFGITAQEFNKLRASIVSVPRRFRHPTGSSPAQVAKLLASQVTAEISRLLPVRKTDEDFKRRRFVEEYFTALSIADYAFWHISFDSRVDTDPSYVSARQERPFLLFAEENPRATCAGYSKIAAEMSNSLGIKCSTVNGVCRWMNASAPTDDNHSWVIFEFSNGVRLPADVVPMFPNSRPVKDRNLALYNWQALPVTRRSWELFMAMHWTSKVRWTPSGQFMDGGNPRFADPGQTNPDVNVKFYEFRFEQWANIRKEGYLRLLNWYTQRVYGTSVTPS